MVEQAEGVKTTLRLLKIAGTRLRPKVDIKCIINHIRDGILKG